MSLSLKLDGIVQDLQQKVQKTDSSTLTIIFAATLCAVLPLDISQLTVAIVGAVFYAILQKHDKKTIKKPLPQVQHPWRNVKPQSNPQARAPKPRGIQTSSGVAKAKPAPQPVVSQTPGCEVYKTSIQPIAKPNFTSNDWDGAVQELLSQITPTDQTHEIVNQLAQRMLHIIKRTIPEAEISGFASGNLSSGKAFGVAVPDVDIVVNVDTYILNRRLHVRSAHAGGAHDGSSEVLDIRKLQKNALRVCTDQLVAAGFKFRRSAFKGLEPKVTLLAPAALGICTESTPIDFSINVATPLHNAALVAECGKVDPRAKELIFLVKRWAKDRAICHTPKGHLSPYMWGLLTMHFLQVRENGEGPLLPSLENSTLKSDWKSAKNAESMQSVGALFKEFVQFFEKEFDWVNEAVSVRAGHRVRAPSLKLPAPIMIQDGTGANVAGPSIEDPFDIKRNLGDCVTTASFARLKEELSRAQELCVRNASLAELLEPWAPSEREMDEPQNEGN